MFFLAVTNAKCQDLKSSDAFLLLDWGHHDWMYMSSNSAHVGLFQLSLIPHEKSKKKQLLRCMQNELIRLLYDVQK